VLVLLSRDRHADMVESEQATRKETARKKQMLSNAGFSVSSCGSSPTHAHADALLLEGRSEDHVPAAALVKPPRHQRPKSQHNHQKKAKPAAAGSGPQPELDRQRRMALGGLRREKYLPSSASLIAVQHAKSVRQHVVARKTAVKSDKVVAACVAAGRVGSLASVVPSSVWGLS